MRANKNKKPITLKRFLHGVFQWQTLLVASAFFAFFIFIAYICGNIGTPFAIADLDSAEYHQTETTSLIFFIVGSVVSLCIALFAAYMCDHPTLLKDKLSKLFLKRSRIKSASPNSAATTVLDCAARNESADGVTPKRECGVDNSEEKATRI